MGVVNLSEGWISAEGCQVQGNAGAGFGVGQGVVMVVQDKAAVCRDCAEPVVGEAFELLPGFLEGAVEFVVGVVHPVHPVAGFEAVLVKCFVVGYQWQSFYEGFYLAPHMREYRGVGGLFVSDAVYHNVSVAVVLGLGAHQAVKGLCDLCIAYYHNPNAADAGTLFVGCFKIYCCKIYHLPTFVLA